MEGHHWLFGAQSRIRGKSTEVRGRVRVWNIQSRAESVPCSLKAFEDSFLFIKEKRYVIRGMS